MRARAFPPFLLALNGVNTSCSGLDTGANPVTSTMNAQTAATRTALGDAKRLVSEPDCAFLMGVISFDRLRARYPVRTKQV